MKGKRQRLSQPQTHVRVALGLALFLYGAAMLVWSGTFHSSDGLAMYTVADSLVRYGRLNVEQIRWMGLQQGTVGPDGLLYSRKGFGTTAVVLPLVAAGFLLPGTGPVHVALLAGPLLTALGGVLLYLAIVRAFPGMARRWAILAVLAWGLASPAWAYTKTLFSEPLVALATVGALERLVALERASRRETWQRAAFGVAAWLAVGLLARAAHGVVVPLFGLAAGWVGLRRGFFRCFEPTAWRPVTKFLLVPVLPIATSLLATAWYNWARFGNPFVTGYLESEAFTAIWWQGIVGQLVSPGRGLLWYAPWAVTAIWGMRRAWRFRPASTFAALSAVAAYVLLYGKWYMWHGGFAWGPRFLVPVLPLLAWSVAPAAATRPRPFALLVGGGIAANLVGVAWDFDLHQAALMQTGLPLFDPRTFFDPQYAQIPGLLRLGRLDNLDVAWMVEGRLLLPLAGAAWGLALVGLVGGAWSTRPSKGRLSPTLLAALSLLLTGVLLVEARRFSSPAYQAVTARLTAEAGAEVMIWHDDPPGTERLLNLYKGRALILGANETNSTPSAEVADLLARLATRPAPVWVVTDGPGRPENALDRLAGASRGLVEEETVGHLRVAYYFDTSAWQPQPVGATLGLGGTSTVRLVSADITPVSTPGGIVAVRLAWRAVRPPPEDYQVFLHVLAPDGQRVAQHDGPPQNGLAPTSTWQPGQVYQDVHAVRLPPDTPPGAYALVVGMYRLSDLTRLRAPDGRDAFEVGSVEVRRSQSHD